MIELDLDVYRRMVVLTGAGISVASGLPTYRGAGGVWQREGLAERATAETLERDPLAVWQTFGPMREKLLEARPNPAHRALAELQARFRGHFTLITQNVDGLHQAAGSEQVVELHGNLHRTRCSSARCSLAPFQDDRVRFQRPPACPRCGAPLRPDIVLFGELIDPGAMRRVKAGLRECDLFLAVGTSGTVTPAAKFVSSARYAGARTVMVNTEPMDPPNPAFDEQCLGRAEELLPQMLGTG